jgi:hypothetical protein
MLRPSDSVYIVCDSEIPLALLCATDADGGLHVITLTLRRRTARTWWATVERAGSVRGASWDEEGPQAPGARFRIESREDGTVDALGDLIGLEAVVAEIMARSDEEDAVDGRMLVCDRHRALRNWPTRTAPGLTLVRPP